MSAGIEEHAAEALSVFADKETIAEVPRFLDSEKSAAIVWETILWSVCRLSDVYFDLRPSATVPSA